MDHQTTETLQKNHPSLIASINYAFLRFSEGSFIFF